MRSETTIPVIAFAVGLVALIAAPPATAHPGAGIVVDRDGQIYFSHTGLGIWKIDLEGKLLRREGPGWHFLALDSDGRFIGQHWPRYREPLGTGGIGYADSVIKPVGTSPTLLCGTSFPIEVGPDGALYYPDVGSDELVHIMRLTPLGEPTDFATLPLVMKTGTGNKPEKALWIHGLAAGRDGDLFYTEDDAVRRVDRTGKVTAIAEKIEVPECGRLEGEPARPYLRELDVAADGTVYVASFGCQALLRISPSSKITVALRSSELWRPTGVAVKGDDVYVLEYLYRDVERREEWLPRVRKLSANGAVTTLATIKEVPK